MDNPVTRSTETGAEGWRQSLRLILARNLIDPIVSVLARLGVSPNVLTLLGLAVAIGAAVPLAFGQFLIGGVIVLAGSSLDMLDGALARATQKTSKFGGFLDSTTDRVAEGVILLGLLIHYANAAATEEILLIFIAMLASVLVSYIRARAEGLGLSCKVGIVTRPERVVLLSLGLIIDQVTIFLYLVAVLSALTAAHRFVHVWRQTADTSDGAS